MGCFGTDLSRVRRAVSSCPAPAPSWFIFNSLTLYFNVIALPPPAPPASPACLSRYFLGKARQRRQRQLGPPLGSGTWAEVLSWVSPSSSYVFTFLMAAAAKCIFPATFYSFFSSLLFLLFFTFATLPSQLAEPKIVCTALKKAGVETGVARLIAALSQSAKGATSAAAATASQQNQSI